MAKDNKVSMPSGMGGLVNYSSDYKSSIQFQPQHVVAVIIVIAIFMILLHLFY